MPEDPVEHDGDPPKIDISAAIGDAGDEVERLGYEGVPDTGPVLEESDASRDDAEVEIDRVANEFPPD
ncbi:MAG: hypothetical protein ACXV8R_07880 [Acidimicrobiia bacterium]